MVQEPTTPLPTDEPLRLAVLLHEGAASGDHLDLLAGPAATDHPDARTAWTWRLPLEAWRDGALAAGRHRATRLAPHRAHYLGLEASASLDGGRGRVTPLGRLEARGRLAASRVEIRTADRVLTLVPMDSNRSESERWILEVVPTGAAR